MIIMLPVGVQAQLINNTVTYRNIKQTNYVRHDYENDFFSASDKLYSQGINMEVVTPGFAKLPTSYLLLHPKNSRVQYGLSLQHNAFTPTSISDDKIRLGDQPYAASLSLQPFTISTNEAKRQRITTMLSIGVMGQIAGGQWMQETIHRNLDNVMPEGWQYQIANDAVVNYRLFYEKNLIQIDNVLSVNATGLADAGTLQTMAGIGANIIVGYFESPYKTVHNRRLAIYLYTHPQAYAVGYDAMLQGGLFNSISVYTIDAANVERVFVDNKAGIVIRYGGLYLEYFQGQMTKRFRTGENHAWGGIMIGVGF